MTAVGSTQGSRSSSSYGEELLGRSHSWINNINSSFGQLRDLALKHAHCQSAGVFERATKQPPAVPQKSARSAEPLRSR